MKNKFEVIHTVTQDALNCNPQWNMPYAPCIRVLSGNPLYISGVNAAPIYHEHPHRKTEFDHLNFDPENQAKLTMENLMGICQRQQLLGLQICSLILG